jgi:hypothetical protein
MRKLLRVEGNEDNLYMLQRQRRPQSGSEAKHRTAKYISFSLERLARRNRNDGRFTLVPSAEEAITTMLRRLPPALRGARGYEVLSARNSATGSRWRPANDPI